ncbi:ferric reductase like transmembrane component-domain-containing protein [Cyathus striatus]|nr:ferric reductase like transmembrane component-domain-containing protein [Cyathus striatus]
MVMVYNVNIFILAILALAVLLRSPRAIALFGSPGDWSSGFILRSIPYRPSRSVRANQPAYPPPAGAVSDDVHTIHSYSHAQHVERLDEKGAPVEMTYPPHFSTCPKFLRPVLAPFRIRVSPGFSVARAITVTVYFYILLFEACYKSNPLIDAMRTGWIAVAHLPFVFNYATKNNVLVGLLGFGYEKKQFNYLHRFLGRAVVLAGNLHSIYYFYKWSMAGTFVTNIKQPSNTWGFIALICLDVLFFFSIEAIRNRAYNFFLVSHVAAFIILVPAVYMHQPSTLPYMLAVAGIWGLDHLLRIIKTSFSTATLRPLPELDLTRVEIPYLNSGWRAGQHIRLRVLSTGLGWFGWSETHPFTIASVSNGPEGMVLMVKKAGTWTNRLYEMSKISGYVEAGIIGRQVKVIVEGPYGGPGHTIFASFSAAVFVVGGSGITFALSAIQDLVQKDVQGRSRVKVIELVWTIQDPASLIPLLPALTSIIQQSIFTPVRISVYYTRAATGKFPFPDDFYVPGLTLAPGRPRISKVLDSAISRAVSLGAGVKDTVGITGLLVGDDVAKAVGGVDPVRRDQVGGIEIHEETFGW